MSVAQLTGRVSVSNLGLEVRRLAHGDSEELYITCTLGKAESPEEQLQQAIACASSHNARICRQRVFVPAGALAAYQAAHEQAFAGSPYEVPTQWLRSGHDGGAIQLYAVAGARNWTPLRDAERVVGWAFKAGEGSYAITTGITGKPGTAPAEQARAAFLAGERLLAQAGMTLHDLARTWIYMDDILSWYGELNAVRNRLFVERGLLVRGQSPSDSRVPASTGMGISPANGAKISIEFCGVRGVHLERLPAAGAQRAAYEYGSAFARAAEIASPAGSTLFISGTAAIDHTGQTRCIGDADGQIQMTLENVCAILDQRGYPRESVVEAIAYCKNLEVVNAFRSRFGNVLQWPWVIAVGDVCRDDLLFEVEATAARPEKQP